MILRFLCFCILFCGYYQVGLCQQSRLSDYPEILQSSFLNENQAVKRLSTEEDACANFLNQRYTNLLNDISLVNFSGFLRVKTNHQIGLLVSSLKEGPFIDKTRAYVHYAYTIKIIQNTAFSAGVSPGFLKIGLEEPGIGSKQAMAPDANFDLLVAHPRYFFSYILNQGLNAKLNPLYSNIYLTRYHELRIGANLPLGVYWHLKMQSHNLIYTDRQSQYGGVVLFDYDSKLSFGMGTYNFSTFLAQAKIAVYSYNECHFSFFGSYKQLISKNQFNAYLNSWEVGVTISKSSLKTVHEE